MPRNIDLRLFVLAALAGTMVYASTLRAADANSAASAVLLDELAADWQSQDLPAPGDKCFVSKTDSKVEKQMVSRVVAQLGEAGRAFAASMDKLAAGKVPGADPRWKKLYIAACQARRAKRLAPLLADGGRVVFTKHYDLGGSHYAYTEGQSDAQAERHFKPGTALCLLDADAGLGQLRVLIDDAKGVIRDPDVSYDGKRILFAWKKSDRDDDYHLYEMTAATGKVRQLTDGLGFADYEGAYLPDGNIVFSSTRCVQIVDCWWTEVSNLYLCDKDGKFMRRVGFDQVHTNYPTVTPDGRVIYTRWDYNDRGQLYPQGLFVMNADGTGQSELYGNNSWFPTTIMHARAIPGTRKILAVLSGHHTHQRGKLAIIDPSAGTQEASGVTMVAPLRPAKAVKVDRYGQSGEQFQYPYPIDERHFLVAYSPAGGRERKVGVGYGIYFMDVEGRRELLARDPKISCQQPVLLARRPVPQIAASAVDYSKTEGVYYVRDVYAGPGLKGVPRGTVKRLRVVKLDFRAAGVGRNGNHGPAGGALVSTPISIDNGSWDVKTVLGTTPVQADGSAMFRVPARTPVYFQLLDANGLTVQTMRSWSTLQPGETFSCVGCHEPKNEAPPADGRVSLAARHGSVALDCFNGAPEGFSFPKDIQPILDKHCISCHNDRSKKLNLTGKPPVRVTGKEKAASAARAAAKASGIATPAGDRPVADDSDDKKAFSLLGQPNVDTRAKRYWSDSYLALTQNGKPNRLVRWLNVQSVPPMLPPYYAGSSRSDLVTMLRAGHQGVKLSRPELDRISCWIDLLVPYCGDYTEAAAWSDAEKQKYARYLAKRKRMEAEDRKNIEAMLGQ